MAGGETVAIFEGKILSWALLLQQEKDQSLKPDSAILTAPY